MLEVNLKKTVTDRFGYELSNHECFSLLLARISINRKQFESCRSAFSLFIYFILHLIICKQNLFIFLQPQFHSCSYSCFVIMTSLLSSRGFSNKLAVCKNLKIAFESKSSILFDEILIVGRWVPRGDTTSWVFYQQHLFFYGTGTVGLNLSCLEIRFIYPYLANLLFLFFY